MASHQSWISIQSCFMARLAPRSTPRLAAVDYVVIEDRYGEYKHENHENRHGNH